MGDIRADGNPGVVGDVEIFAFDDPPGGKMIWTPLRKRSEAEELAHRRQYQDCLRKAFGK